MFFNGTVHTSNKFSNLLLNLCPRMLLEPFTLDTCSATSCGTFSCTRQFHSPEVATARRFVAAHVASVKGLGHKLSNKFGNLCPSPFTLGHIFGNMLLNLFGNVWPVWKHYYARRVLSPLRNTHDAPQDHHVKTWRHPQNQKYMTYHDAVTSRGHRQHARKIGEVRPCGFRVTQ